MCKKQYHSEIRAKNSWRVCYSEVKKDLSRPTGTSKKVGKKISGKPNLLFASLLLEWLEIFGKYGIILRNRILRASARKMRFRWKKTIGNIFGKCGVILRNRILRALARKMRFRWKKNMEQYIKKQLCDSILQFETFQPFFTLKKWP